MGFPLRPKSLSRLDTCHADLKRLVLALTQEMDIIVVCGFRGEMEQNAAFVNGKSKLRWPHSKHNLTPSEAVDLAPCTEGKINWDDLPSFYVMCNRVERIAKELGIKVRLGRDFTFKDIDHVELHEKNK